MLVVVVEENWSVFQKTNWKKLVAVVGIRSVDQKRNRKQKVVNGVGVVALKTAHGGARQRRNLWQKLVAGIAVVPQRNQAA